MTIGRNQLLHWGLLAQVGLALICLAVSATFFPGVMLLVPFVIALTYFVLAIRASIGYRFAHWIAFVISVVAGILFTAGVYSYIAGGFDYFEGDWPHRDRNSFTPMALIAADGSTISITEPLVATSHDQSNTDWYNLLPYVFPYAFLFSAILAIGIVCLQIIGVSHARKKDA